MLLILFIENSFKHGIKNNVNKIRIDISLKVEGGVVVFYGKKPVGRQAGLKECRYWFKERSPATGTVIWQPISA